MDGFIDGQVRIERQEVVIEAGVSLVDGSPYRLKRNLPLSITLEGEVYEARSKDFGDLLVGFGCGPGQSARNFLEIMEDQFVSGEQTRDQMIGYAEVYHAKLARYIEAQ